MLAHNSGTFGGPLRIFSGCEMCKNLGGVRLMKLNKRCTPTPAEACYHAKSGLQPHKEGLLRISSTHGSFRVGKA